PAYRRGTIELGFARERPLRPNLSGRADWRVLREALRRDATDSKTVDAKDRREGALRRRWPLQGASSPGPLPDRADLGTSISACSDGGRAGSRTSLHTRHDHVRQRHSLTSSFAHAFCATTIAQRWVK